MAQSFKQGEAPWEKGKKYSEEKTPPGSFKLGEAPWEKATSKTESLLRGAAQGGSLGFADEIAGGLEAAFTDKTYKQARDESRAAFKKAHDDNPKTYTTGEIGSALATSLIPGVAVGGTVARAAAGAAALGAAGGLGASESDDLGGMAYDTAKGAAIGGALGAVGQGLAKGAQKLAPIVGKGLKLTPKANAALIEEAAARQGIKATPGMLMQDEVIGGMESSLSQSPSLAGMMMRKSTQPVEKSIDRIAAESVKDATTLSPFEVGQRIKEGVKGSVEKKFEPSRKVFDELAESTPYMKVGDKSLDRVGRNIENLREVKLMEGSEGSNVANRYAKWLRNAETVQDVKAIRMALGKDFAAAEGAQKKTLGDMYERISRLEQNSMVRSAADTMREGARSATGKTGEKMAAEGESIGRNMVTELKGANKSYSNEIRGLQDYGKNVGIQNVKNPEHFTNQLDRIDSERIADTLYSPSDYRSMQSTAANFPEQQQLLRQAQLAKIRGKAELADKSLSTPTLLRQSNKIGKEAAGVLYGKEGVAKLRDAQTIMEALPEYVGPSGTPKGLQYLEAINPVMQVKEGGRYAAYKALTDPRTQKVADYLMKSPKVQALSKENPKAFQAMVLDFSKRAASAPEKLPMVAGPSELDNDSSRSSNYQEPEALPTPRPNREPQSEPKRGTEKWAEDGFESVAQMDPSLDRAALLANPKTKNLLIAASDMKPGSRAMNDVILKLKRHGRTN